MEGHKGRKGGGKDGKMENRGREREENGRGEKGEENRRIEGEGTVEGGEERGWGNKDTTYIYTSVKIIKNEVGCRDDTVPKTVDTRRHCEEE